eukprot:gnl/MRDRNA2_/MRDRNA2_98936_c0_seq1.p1 gnl/MRDRNA2_/MRDRNA2_98936_c0~~gnl/MRDRNA2_/MRDRNA2_98936_c0_seq1.p1  ORF type:complete len:259 (+),score=63.25 gnl/MRDRNA2_/MRDRNA2_98936_c0_seq1:76-852(+)
MASKDYDAIQAGLEADRDEMKNLLSQCTRPAVRKELEAWALEIENEIGKHRVKGAPPTPLDKQDKDAIQDLAAEKQRREILNRGNISVPKAEHFKEITTFALELGRYNSPTVEVDLRLKGVEALPPENITCVFGECSFDLKVVGLDGDNYRMVKTNLEKDIVPAESSWRVKKNHVIVVLQKVKGEHGYDSWSDLTGKRRKAEKKPSSLDDPQAGIMSMMKDLYDDGDDNMKKIIGEAMYKAKTGQKADMKDSLSGMDD